MLERQLLGCKTVRQTCDGRFHNKTSVVTMQMNEDGDWRPSCFLVDANLAESAAIRAVYGDTLPIFICTWHMQKATRLKLRELVRL